MNDVSSSEDFIRLIYKVASFLKKESRAIFIGAVGGLLFATLYLVFTPNQYEAVSIVKMAKVVPMNYSYSNSNSNNNYMLGVYVEEPNSLIARLSLPTTLTAEVYSECSQDGEALEPGSMPKFFKASNVRGVGGVVEIRVVRGSKDIALACSSAIFRLIKDTQGQLSLPILSEIAQRLNHYEARLKSIPPLEAVENGFEVGDSNSRQRNIAVYEKNRVLDEIDILKGVLAFNATQETALISPAFVGDKPISPVKRKSLIIGLLGGVILSLMLAVARRRYRLS